MRKEELRIVFMGTPEFAVASLAALVESGYNVVGVVTQPDKPVGRHGSQLQKPAVKQYAEAHGLPVLQPEKMRNEEFLHSLSSWQADLQVVVAYRMLPKEVWDMPRFGTFNVHASLLPQYRGAAPINWAIINGEQQTGITTFFLDEQIDTGQMILREPVPIPADANVEYLYNQLMAKGAELCVRTVDLILSTDGNVPALDQKEFIEDGMELHPAPKIFKETCQIDWNQPAKRIYDFIRGLSPYPGAWGLLKANETFEAKIFQSEKTSLPCPAESGTLMVNKKQLFIATVDEWLEIKELQLSGKRRMNAADFINGMRNKL